MNKAAKRKPYDRWTPEVCKAFITIWQKAKSTKEVAKALNIRPVDAGGIAALLRNKGYKLKHRKRQPKQSDLTPEGLAKLITDPDPPPGV